MFKHKRLQTKITLLVTIIVTVSVLTLMIFFADWTIRNVRDKVETNILNIAKLVAHTEVVRTHLEKGDPEQHIRTYIEELLTAVNDVEFIVVADMNSIRYSHPNSERIYKEFTGGDQKLVVEFGETYISEATGTLGKSLRAFTPIYDLDGHHQIGFVSVGTLTSSIENAKKEAIFNIMVVTGFALVIGGFGAFVLASNIKHTLFGLEPDEIAHLYTDKIAMMDAIYEGIIAIDKESKITMINDSAMSILQLSSEATSESLIGCHVMDVFPTTRLPQIMACGIAEYDTEQRVKDTIIMTNRVPIFDKDEVIGAIATFRDKTNVIRMAEELTGVKQIVEALRANTHEFMNKLHVILGLIQMEEYDEAKNFIRFIKESQEQMGKEITLKVKDKTIAGLLLGKMNRARELGIDFKVQSESCLENHHGVISTLALVSIIGNLIENALEATSNQVNEIREVSLTVVENEKMIYIEVSDNGMGISKEDQLSVFKRGFSTKRDSNGVGLSIVKNYTDEYKGTIEIQSEIGVGTQMIVNLPKEVVR